jgi:isoleucyl-tRNA synthetase
MMQKLQDGVQADYQRYEFHLAVQKVLGFCSETLGSFYLDILKDRLYTSGENSKARRSAQNALYQITQALTRLIAPILSFTGEEVAAVLNGNADVSVFEGVWHDLPDAQMDAESMSRWLMIDAWRAKVNKQLEEARSAGLIGSALAAEVDLFASGEDFEVLTRLGDDLRLVLITSRATVHHVAGADEHRIDVSASLHGKCERCWHYREDIGTDAGHPTLCGRCVSNLYGAGEARHYA